MKSRSKTLRRAGTIILASAAGASCFEIARRYRRDIRRARARVARGSQIALTSSGPIEYAILGEGPPVLVVHGAGGGFDQGLEMGRALARSGFRVIAPSRFGYLRTPLPADASAEAQADAHAALLGELGIEKCAVFGASAGAPSSVQLALRHPDRVGALVLAVPALYAPRAGDPTRSRIRPGTRWLFETALRSDFLFWATMKSAPEIQTRAILGTLPAIVRKASPSERARVAETLEQILPVTPRRRGLANDAAVLSRLERYYLERIEAPTLVISVADDLYGTFEPARYTADRIPRARFLGFPAGGHLWVGHHETAVSAIGGFLSEATPAPAGPDRLSSPPIGAPMSASAQMPGVTS